MDAGICLGQKLHPRRRRMNAELQRLEIEPAILGDDDFAIEHAAIGQLRPQRLEQLGKIAIQRFLIAALDQDLVPVAEDQRAKPIPFRLEDPIFRRPAVRSTRLESIGRIGGFTGRFTLHAIPAELRFASRAPAVSSLGP